MFAGIIKEVCRLIKNKDKIEIECKKIDLKGIEVGESVSVNGVCLTVIEKKQNILKFQLMQETLKTTNLGRLKTGNWVNVEPALRLQDMVSGHIILGHVDFQSKLKKIKNLHPKEKTFYFSLPKEKEKYFVEKGSVAVNGISLTINQIKDSTFCVVVSEFTLKNTNLKYAKVGDFFNIEIDIFAKFVFRNS